MTKNPIINGLVGLAYIGLVATILFNTADNPNIPESILIPIAFLSLFVFSAACMSYIFLYQPLQLFLEGNKKEGVDLFLQTLAVFAISAFVFVAIGLYVTSHFS